MKGLNRQVLMGNVAGDIELQHTKTGTPFANFRMATNETYKNRDGETVTDTEWHTVVVWEKSAEILAQYVKKGDPLYVEGKTVHRQYEDKDGNTRYVTEVKLREFTLLPRSSGGPAASSDESEGPAAGKSSARGKAAPKRGGAGDSDDDLPF